MSAVVPTSRAGLASYLANVLVSSPLPFGEERRLQEAVSSRLIALGIPHECEFDLTGEAGRIDVFIPTGYRHIDGRPPGHQDPVGVGLELKIAGSPNAVWRQLQRYARSPQIHDLVLVTGRQRVAAYLEGMACQIRGPIITTTLSGTPLHVVATWRGGL